MVDETAQEEQVPDGDPQEDRLVTDEDPQVEVIKLLVRPDPLARNMGLLTIMVGGILLIAPVLMILVAFVTGDWWLILLALVGIVLVVRFYPWRFRDSQTYRLQVEFQADSLIIIHPNQMDIAYSRIAYVEIESGRVNLEDEQQQRITSFRYGHDIEVGKRIFMAFVRRDIGVQINEPGVFEYRPASGDGLEREGVL